MKSFTHQIFVSIILLSVFAIHPFSGKSQVSYGVKGGLVISSVEKKMKHNSSYSYSTRPKEGTLAGVWLYAPKVYRNIGIQAELLYSNRGSEYITVSSYYGDGYSPYGYGYGYPSQGNQHVHFANESLHTLNLPLAFVFRSDKIFHPYVGAELSYLMKVNDKPSHSDYKKFGVGAIAGIQAKLADKITADLRYNYGINSYKSTPGYSNEKFRTRGFELSLAYTLGNMTKK